MSKKTRKKVSRNSPARSSGASDKLADNKPALKAASAQGKTYMSTADLEKRYQYVKDDLKRVAIIAIPMIVGLIIAAFFIKI
jgi:hypothetical protein